jgi:DMSO/TMAO reductase YedYZ heme-binding membrane subunit
MPLTKPINIGMVGLAFFYLVMLVGVLPKKWKITTALKVLRKEWSIVGFLIIAPHSLFNLYEILFQNRSVTWFGISTFVIMLPLFITSFTIIRKKMTPKSWKFLQSFAYIAYCALFVHIILNASEIPNLIAYIVAFTPYVLIKSVMLLKKIKK